MDSHVVCKVFPVWTNTIFVHIVMFHLFWLRLFFFRTFWTNTNYWVWKHKREAIMFECHDRFLFFVSAYQEPVQSMRLFGNRMSETDQVTGSGFVLVQFLSFTISVLLRTSTTTLFIGWINVWISSSVCNVLFVSSLN